MKYSTLSAKVFGLMLLMMSFIIPGCTNHDTVEEDPAITVTNDHTVTGHDTSAIQADTSAQADIMHTTDNTAVDMNAPMAKPDPAKKGKKGKVSVTTAAPANNMADANADASGVYSKVDVYPTFPGGDNALQNYFDKNLSYPEEATNEGVDGTVYLSFIVDENGRVSSPQVVGKKLGYGLETEAIRVVNKMPSWTPGKLKGKNVKARYTLPVKFVLY